MRTGAPLPDAAGPTQFIRFHAAAKGPRGASNPAQPEPTRNASSTKRRRDEQSELRSDWQAEAYPTKVTPDSRGARMGFFSASDLRSWESWVGRRKRPMPLK